MKTKGKTNVLKRISHVHRQYIALLKHFLWQFVYNDMMKFDSQYKLSILVLAGIMAGTAGYISFEILSHYTAGMLIEENIWTAKTYYFSLVMAFTGIVFVIIWDRVFLDKQDVHNILPLPVKPGTLIFSKLTSVFIFVGLVSIIFGLPSTFVFTLGLASQQNVNLPGFAFSYFVALFAANFFIFLFLAFLQSILRIFLKGRLFSWAGVFFQTILIGGFISIFAWLPIFFEHLPGLKASFYPVIYWYPPLWFVGLHESMIGNRDIIFNAHVFISIIALSFLFMLYLMTFYVSYSKSISDRSQPGRNLRFSRPVGFFAGIFNSLFLRNNGERAFFYFVLKTIRRNRGYKIHLVVLLVIPAGILLTRLLYIYYGKIDLLPYSTGGDILSIPLVLFFSLVLGLRNTILHPDTLPANWVFKVTEINAAKYYYIQGIKKALILYALIPLFLVFLFFHGIFWGVEPAFYHSFYCLSLAFLLLELAFFHYKKVPFASSYAGWKLNLKALWPLYLGGFLVYVFVFTWLDLFLFETPLFYWVFYILVFGIILLLARMRKSPKRDFDFIYEEEPEPSMTSL
jgi:hypothetical protein